MIEEKAFIKTKSILFFKRINNLEFNDDEVDIEFQRLSGISNLIFRVQIVSSKYNFIIDTIFFKVFGRISSNKF
jgi:hypothetical protein